MLDWAAYLVLGLLSLVWYIRSNDGALHRIPIRALKHSPIRCTPQDVVRTAVQLAKAPKSIDAQLPPKTGRRYIIVGGGFLGGWIVVLLLRRGEDPKNIRVLDIRPPTRRDLTTGSAKDVHFMKVDISDKDAVQRAFETPWPESASGYIPKLSVIHTAANIRFYERHISLVPSSSRVNENGTQHVIDAACSVGASTMVYTSSGSVGVRSSKYLLWPWQKEPDHFVQFMNDDDAILPQSHGEFFSNYAYTKLRAERRVRAADRRPSGEGLLRTGCIRPGNGVFGPGGDMLCGASLVRRNNPSWIHTIVQNFVYVENCALAHLCYEQRLIEIAEGSPNPDIGGQSFTVCDPGPPPTYGDVYTTLETITDGETYFPSLSPSLILLLSYVIEFLYVARVFLTPYGLNKLIPAINGDLVNLQPSLFNLMMAHLIFDDSRARLPPEEGGLGYEGAWSTLEGLHKTAEEHKKGIIPSEQRSDVAGVSFGFNFVKAQRGVSNFGAMVADEIGVNPVQIMSTT